MIILSTVLQSTACKAYRVADSFRPIILDQAVIELYNSLRVQHEQPLVYRDTMKNLYGIDTRADPVDLFFDTLYTFISNDVLGALAAEDVKFDELETYHGGLGRSLLILVKLITTGVIRRDQARVALKELMKPIWIGTMFEDFLNKTSIFEEDETVDIDSIIGNAIMANGKAVEEYKRGKEKALMALVGFVMKQVKINPKLLVEKLKVKIDQTP